MPHWSKEKVIKEKRTIEAIKKNLMGNAGKLGFICKVLGNSIIRQGSAYTNIFHLDDPYDTQHYEEEHEQTMGEGNLGPLTDPGHILDYDSDFVHNEGYCFDGLRWGMHLEIVRNFAEKRITATYKGHKVYEEIGGDLMSYAPFEEWEEKIDRLYKTAKDRFKKEEPQRMAEMELKITEKKNSFFQHLRERWGI